MSPHPEGGHYVETWRGDASAIYFLLQRGERSHWHRVHDADEIWLHHAGAPIDLAVSPAEGIAPIVRRLGGDVAAGEQPQLVVPAGAWQSADTTGDFTLVSCVVAPPFSFDRFELAPPEWAPTPEAAVGDLFVFYGSLMRGLHPEHQPDFHSRLSFAGEVTLAGELYLVPDAEWPYPGIVLGGDSTIRAGGIVAADALVAADSVVSAELWRVEDLSVVAGLDDWELLDASAGFETATLDTAYVRRRVRCVEPAVDAWVYVGNHADTTARIGGSWRAWRETHG